MSIAFNSVFRSVFLICCLLESLNIHLTKANAISNFKPPCNQEFFVGIKSPKWSGSLKITPIIGLEDIDLSMLFENHTNYRDLPRTITIRGDDNFDVKLNAVYSEAEKVTSIKTIELNGQGICEGGSINKQPSGVPNSFYQFVQNAFDVNKESECGMTLANSLVPLINRGQTTASGEFPWHASIFYRETEQSENRYICGGSLISYDTVLTAAHCVTLPKSDIRVEQSRLTIYVGKEFLNATSSSEQSSKVASITVHESFIPSKFYSDIAIIKLETRIKPSPFVNPVCLWAGAEQLSNIVDRSGLIPGFGLTEHGVASLELLKVKMPVVTTGTCITSNVQVFQNLLLESSFCAGFRNGSSVCNGDSGGGMVFEENNKWFIRGIVSFSKSDDDNRYICDPYSYAIFTDVAKFKQWITEHM